MDLLKRMNSVLDYIEDNLDGEIKDSKIAMLSASSKGMFQRIFTLITDMTLSEYIRKRKLTQAAYDIRNADTKIIDIAVKYGYNSATAFASAFKIFHGVTPSNARTSDIGLQSFQRFTFTLVLSVKGGNDNMQYRNINLESAEEILQKMVDKGYSIKCLQNISERNGVKSACDGRRVAVILPDGIDDWDLNDAYFETGDENNPKFDLNKVVFNYSRKNATYNFEISRQQVEDLANSFAGTDKQFIGLNVNTMEIMKPEELKYRNEERIMAFNEKYLKEMLNFIMCSSDEYIEVYYVSNTNALVVKSSRLYAAILPVRIT